MKGSRALSRGRLRVTVQDLAKLLLFEAICRELFFS